MDNNQNHSQFPWTPGGLELLETINNYITENGGHVKLYEIVKVELSPNTFKINQKKVEEVFIMVIKYGIRYRDAAKFLSISKDSFKMKISAFKDRFALTHRVKRYEIEGFIKNSNLFF